MAEQPSLFELWLAEEGGIAVSLCSTPATSRGLTPTAIRFPFQTPSVGSTPVSTPFFKKMAEREGFEPPVPLGTTVFKTAAFDHSAISPPERL